MISLVRTLSSSSRIFLQTTTHSSQMKTPGPAIKRRANSAGLPQKLQALAASLFLLIHSSDENTVNNAIFYAFTCIHIIVTFQIPGNMLGGFLGVGCQVINQHFF